MTLRPFAFAAVARPLEAIAAGVLVPEGWAASVDALPVAGEADWDCVVAEVRLAAGPLRGDIMGAVAGVPACALPVRHPRDWRALPAARAWHRGGPLADAPLLWFEWDLPDRAAEPPLSSVGVSEAVLGGVPDPARVRARAHAAIAALREAEGLPEAGPALDRALDELGDAGALLHVASLAARGLPRWRATVRVRAAALRGWLGRIDWAGDAPDLGAVLFAMGPPFERVGVQIELLPETGPYLGLETREIAAGPGAAARMGGLLRAVATVAPVDPGRAEAVMGWVAGAGGAGDRGGAEAAGERAAGERFAYLKLVPSAVGWEAKAYLGIVR